MTAHGCAELHTAQELMQQHEIDFIIADLRLEGGARRFGSSQHLTKKL